MSQWQNLTDLTGDREFVVTEVQLEGSGIRVSGQFEMPPLARLRYEDQVFVVEFLRCHGSIKHMEGAFGISYPTVKNRLNKLIQQLRVAQVEQVTEHEEVFDLLERGEITVEEATARLQG
jgi:hypothetical protein